MAGKIYIVGVGPGGPGLRTPAAVEAIKRADVVVGYRTYINLISDLLHGKEVFAAGMREELLRASVAVNRASEDAVVAVVSDGDPQVFGMAPLVLELMSRSGASLDVEVVPGVTAALAAGALLGSPLGNDFAVLNLSPLLTPREVILRRAEAVALADYVVALYNPIDVDLLKEVISVFRRHRGGGTPVGIVKNAYREGQGVWLTTLDGIDYGLIDMRTTIIVGNSETYVWNGFMITPRGYHRKYAYP